MTLIQIYCLGFLTEAIYILIKRLSWDAEKVKRFNAEFAAQPDIFGLPARKLYYPMILLMCLLWPYVWIDTLILKRGPR